MRDIESRVLPSLCPEGYRRNHSLGDKSALCEEPQPLGRIVIGCYGRLVLRTVSNFVTLAGAGIYDGTLFHKAFPGEFVMVRRLAV